MPAAWYFSVAVAVATNDWWWRWWWCRELGLHEEATISDKKGRRFEEGVVRKDADGTSFCSPWLAPCNC